MTGWLQIPPPKLERQQRVIGTALPHTPTEAELNHPPTLALLTVTAPHTAWLPTGAHATTDKRSLWSLLAIPKPDQKQMASYQGLKTSEDTVAMQPGAQACMRL